jgi:oligosaccharide repeat unit polymerase
MGIRKKFKNGRWITFFYIIMLAVLFLYKPLFKSTIDISNLIIYISCFFGAVFIHLISQKDKNWFRMDIIFLLGFGVVHFQWAIMIALSEIRPQYLLHNIRILDSSYINFGTWLSTVGALSWFIGYSWLLSKGKKIIEFNFQYKKLFWFTVMSFILFVMTAGSKFLSGAVYKGQGGGTAGEGISVYFQVLMSISILVLTAVVVLGKKNKFKSNALLWFANLDKKYLVLAGSYVLLFLSIGDRGIPMQIVISFLVLFGALVRPIVFKEFIVIIVVGAIVLTLVGLGRSVESDENILVAGSNEAEFTSNYDATIELANSARTLYIALYDVPDHHNYFWGKLWLGKLLTVFPLAQSQYLKFTNDKPYELGSGKYITYLRFGLYPPSGEGTSLIADIYLNFGLMGVIFFMLLLGLVFKKGQNELQLQRSFYWIIFAALLASGALYMGRGGLFGGLRTIVWGLILAMVFVKRKNKVL